MRAPPVRPTVAAATLVALGLRLVGTAAQPLQWDEGWSLALARLPLAEALRLTALDVHPPLYYVALRGWLWAVGATPFAARALSALVGAAGVPLAAAAAGRWAAVLRPGAPSAARRAARWAAVAIALAPPLVYYGGVARMYALATTAVLAATWGVGRLAAGPRAARIGPALAAAVGAAAAAVGSFYYAGFAVAGLGAAAGLLRPAAWRRWLAWAAATTALAAPWLAYAGPRLAARIGARVGDGGAGPGALDAAAGAGGLDAAGAAAAGGLPGAVVAAAGHAAAAWRAILFVNTGSAALAAVVAAALVVGLARRPRRRPRAGRAPGGDAAASAGGRRAGDDGPRGLALVAGPVALVAAAVALGARAHMFAPRYAAVATPFVGLGLALVAAAPGRRWPAAVAAVGLAAASAPTLQGTIFARSAEWFDPYDPTAVHAAVRSLARPGDLVAFNILSQAGAYESARAPDSPAWTYAQLWDPVHEPAKLAVDRVESAFEAMLRGEAPGAAVVAGRGGGVDRSLDVSPTVGGARPDAAAAARPPAGTAALWLALYRGTAAADTAALKAWADDELFPTAGRWVSDTWLVGYVDAATDATRDLAPPAPAGDGIVLRRARTTTQTPPGGHVAVALRWRAEAAPVADHRVVVRLVDAVGHTVAQRDAVPVNESRPTSTWQAGESLDDRHGLRLPPDVAAGERLRIVVGLVEAVEGLPGPEIDVGAVVVR